MADTSAIERSFRHILDDLDFHQSIISRTRGRFKKYPFRSSLYVLRNLSWKMAIGIGHSPLIPARTFWGDYMRVVFPTYRSVYQFGILDSAELMVQKTLLERLHDGDTFLDVGANIGFYTLLGSALVGALGQVHSFEPTPSTFALLKENVGNRLNVTLNNVGLGGEAGTATLADYGLLNNGLNSMRTLELKGLESNKIQVPVVTLDEYCARKNIKPNMVKLDVEGMELEVLRGAEHVLGTAKPLLLMEFAAYEESAPLVEFLAQHGYQGFYPDVGLTLQQYTPHEHGRMNMLFAPVNAL